MQQCSAAELRRHVSLSMFLESAVHMLLARIIPSSACRTCRSWTAGSMTMGSTIRKNHETKLSTCKRSRRRCWLRASCCCMRAAGVVGRLSGFEDVTGGAVVPILPLLRRMAPCCATAPSTWPGLIGRGGSGSPAPDGSTGSGVAMTAPGMVALLRRCCDRRGCCSSGRSADEVAAFRPLLEDGCTACCLCCCCCCSLKSLLSYSLTDGGVPGGVVAGPRSVSTSSLVNWIAEH